MKTGLPILKVDFDGFIVEEQWPNIGPFREGAAETLKDLIKHEYNTILWTCRHGEQLKAAVEFLKQHGIVFDVVNDHHPCSPYHHLEKGPKPFANYHMDDKNFGPLVPWSDIHYHFFNVKKYHELKS